MTAVFAQQTAPPHPLKCSRVSHRSAQCRKNKELQLTVIADTHPLATAPVPACLCNSLGVNSTSRHYPSMNTGTQQKALPTFPRAHRVSDMYLPICTCVSGDSPAASAAPNLLDLHFPIFLQLMLIRSHVACLPQDLS